MCKQDFTINTALAIQPTPPLPQESRDDPNTIANVIASIEASLPGPWALVRVLGVVLLFVGLGLAFYYLLLFDTTVSTIGEGLVPREWDNRVHNIGRMNQRLTAVIVGIGLSIVGAILCMVPGRVRVETERPGG